MPRELLDNRKEIELAEGISVHLHPAGLAPRILARFIDLLILYAFMLVLQLLFFLSAFSFGFEIAQGVYLIIMFIVIWGYDLLFELMRVPATPGKRALKLRVVQLSGAPTTFSTSFLRALIYPINYMFLGLPAIISILLTKNSQRLGDLAAGTVVVHSMGELVHDAVPIPEPPRRPRISLTREEQVAFVEFGRRYDRLSSSRQNEVVACFDPVNGTANNSLSYALGIASFLNKTEAE